MATDAQALFGEANCYRCFGDGSTADLLKLALLSRWVLNLNPMAATDPQSLMDAGECYACYGLSTVEIMTISLLAQALLALSPSADVSGSALLEYASCFNCFASQAGPGDLMEIALLDQIAAVS